MGTYESFMEAMGIANNAIPSLVSRGKNAVSGVEMNMAMVNTISQVVSALKEYINSIKDQYMDLIEKAYQERTGNDPKVLRPTAERACASLDEVGAGFADLTSGNREGAMAHFSKVNVKDLFDGATELERTVSGYVNPGIMNGAKWALYDNVGKPLIDNVSNVLGEFIGKPLAENFIGHEEQSIQSQSEDVMSRVDEMPTLAEAGMNKPEAAGIKGVAGKQTDAVKEMAKDKTSSLDSVMKTASAMSQSVAGVPGGDALGTAMKAAERGQIR